MRNINKTRFNTKNTYRKIVMTTAAILLIYLIASIYFSKHFFFNTYVNGAKVSLKAHAAAEIVLKKYIEDYKLKLIERNGEAEEIIGQDIGFHYNDQKDYLRDYHTQSSFKWIVSLFKPQKYYIKDLMFYDNTALESKINSLNCLSKPIIEPKNVSFIYSNGSYELVKEVYGNKVKRERLKEAIESSLNNGEKVLNLEEKLCYENPKYTLQSEKTFKTKGLLNKCIGANITYVFEKEKELLDGTIIKDWLSVDEDLEVKINDIAAMKYVRSLSKKYDTVGIKRKFKSSPGRIIEVSGGLYGWKIDIAAETKALLENIIKGETVEKEPVYSQKSLPRGDSEIGSTYVEINITRQYLWFYKNGRLVAQGDVVTGNPNRGYGTVVGTYMLNYKQRDATLKGPGYETVVAYWMPFFGNTGIHDATWQYSFGGSVYKRFGSHGCVNTPLYLAKAIYENIEAGTPIICYEEERK